MLINGNVFVEKKEDLGLVRRIEGFSFSLRRISWVVYLLRSQPTVSVVGINHIAGTARVYVIIFAKICKVIVNWSVVTFPSQSLPVDTSFLVQF